jgi:hypothetical protein
MLADALAYYDETDVRRWFDRNARMTGRYPIVYGSTVEDVRAFRKVPNEAFRAYYRALTAPLILGESAPAGAHEGGNEHRDWIDLFGEELERIKKLPEALDFYSGKIGPSDLSPNRVGDYLQHALGCKVHTGTGGLSVAWLIRYEVAEALAKTLGLVPMLVGI